MLDHFHNIIAGLWLLLLHQHHGHRLNQWHAKCLTHYDAGLLHDRTHARLLHLNNRTHPRLLHVCHLHSCAWRHLSS